ncbi:MAG: PolC-type DNA polymerase III [Christensenellales bacterium]|jgi:DNA polymerase-3 subunit alpha (Gram-positive type)
MQQTTRGPFTDATDTRRAALTTDDPNLYFFIASAVVSASTRRWAIDAVVAGPAGDAERRAIARTIRQLFPYVHDIDITLRQPETLEELGSADPRILAEWIGYLARQQGSEREIGNPETLPLCVQDGGLMYSGAGRMREPDRAAARAICRILSRWLGREVPLQEPQAPDPAVREERTSDERRRSFRRKTWKSPITVPVTPMAELTESSGFVAVEGEILRSEHRQVKSGKDLFVFDMTDRTSSVTVKMFAPAGSDAEDMTEMFAEGRSVRVAGEWLYDDFSREMVLRARQAEPATPRIREDNAPRKRIELHLHTQMSAMDGLTSVDSALRQAARWGHSAIAITDHGVVQAFPDAAALAHELGIKLILGMEAYITGGHVPAVLGANDAPLTQPCVVLDIETTGLTVSRDGITEIAAVLVEGGQITGRFQTFVNPGVPIPPTVVHLTGITDDMVRDAPDATEALRRFHEFAGGRALVAHNAGFDMGFLRRYGREAGAAFDQPVVDTLALARALYPTNRSHKLAALCKKLGVRLEGHHRAINDAEATAGLFRVMIEELRNRGVSRLDQVNAALSEGAVHAVQTFHATLLVRNPTGLRNLYRLISESHLHHLYRGKPHIPAELLAERREGLLVGSACEAGELYQAILRGEDRKRIDEIVSFYDYLEIQPLGNNEFMVCEGIVRGHADLIRINRRILELGRKHGKPVVATGDVHFLEPEDEVFRRILMHAQKFEDADNQAPLYLRTTDEMLAEFSYLSSEDREAVVIDNPNRLNELIESVDPLPPYKLYAPVIEGAQEDIVRMTHERARELYGDPLPPVVAARLKKELDAITRYNYSVLYLIAHKLAKKSLEDGYLVGSRGSIGSSLVGFMTGITEVNPLAPHYLCPKCRYSDFDVDVKRFACGTDLPDRVCPVCGAALEKNGYDIPFEVFLGFKGDKVPDIDLNFSGEYQAKAHEYTEVLLGKGNVFKAGTIGTIADKTAFGFVNGYLEEKGLTVTRAEIDRLVRGCTGVRRTTGQHPGGIVVIPAEYDVHEFTPVQRPADDSKSSVITTHFTFDQLHDRLVKLDILGHDDPTMLRMLQDLTGINPRTIPLDDPDTMRIFSSTETIGVDPEALGSSTGAIGIPEFGTQFVRQILDETRPTTMAELIRISGLSHGTDVWLGNAQELIAQGVTTLREAICTRDDIMNALIAMGVPAKMAFDTMESVRKGKGLKPEMEEAMREHDVPSWFIDSCKKIRYMFPKAHAAAYVMMGFRVAYYKVHHPEAYYAAYFTVRADEFDAGIMLGSVEEIRRSIAEITAAGKLNPREKSIVTILEVALEMNLRGIHFTPVDLYRSDATRFLVTPQGIRPPLTALPGLGAAAAHSIVAGREAGRFLSVEDMQKKTRVSKAVVEILDRYRCLGDLPASDQVSFFDALGL